MLPITVKGHEDSRENERVPVRGGKFCDLNCNISFDFNWMVNYYEYSYF